MVITLGQQYNVGGKYTYINRHPGTPEKQKKKKQCTTATGFFSLKNKIKMPNGWRTIKSLVHKIRLHIRRGKGMAESFSREKLRYAPQKEGG